MLHHKTGDLYVKQGKQTLQFAEQLRGINMLICWCGQELDGRMRSRLHGVSDNPLTDRSTVKL